MLLFILVQSANLFVFEQLDKHCPQTHNNRQSDSYCTPVSCSVTRKHKSISWYRVASRITVAQTLKNRGLKRKRKDSQNSIYNSVFGCTQLISLNIYHKYNIEAARFAALPMTCNFYTHAYIMNIRKIAPVYTFCMLL